jgi:hypothetical protein
VLDADDQIAAGGKNIGEKRVFGILDGIAMAEDRDRQIDHLGDRLHFPVAANGEVTVTVRPLRKGSTNVRVL